MNFALSFLCICIPLASIGQGYQALQARGKIPTEFVTKSSEKYLKEKQNFEKTEEKSTARIKNAFYLKSTFSLDNLLKSGYVLFNDPVTEYVNQVAGEILKANPELPTIRFYTLKSTIVNALSTNDGIILINLGLIAQLENESQLAFIICHEISHVLEKHALENYMHVEQVSEGKGFYKKLSFDERQLEQMRYSKENEQEADLIGFELFANTKYSLEKLDGAFDVLQFAHLPIDNIPFNYNLLESENFLFPDEYKIGEVNPINILENEDDEQSTHPSVTIRRQAISDAIKDKTNEGRKPCLISADRFKAVQLIARNELMRLYVANRDYETAIYHAAILLKEDTSAQHLEEGIARALYGLAFYSMENFNDVHMKAEKTEGYLHQVTYLFEQLNKDAKEVVITALQYVLRMRKKYPDNISFSYYTDRLVKLLVQKYDVQWEFFTSGTPAEAKRKVEQITATDSLPEVTEGLSKYDKIKAQSIQKVSVMDFGKYALAEYKSDTALAGIFQKYATNKAVPNSSPQADKKSVNRKGRALNINKLLVFDPIYAFIDQKKKESYRYLESERGQEEFAATIETISKKLGLQITLLDAGKIQEADIDEFNDFAFLNEYVNERLRHPEEIEISMIERDQVLRFAEKYGTEYVNLAALVYVKQRTRLGLLIVGSMIYPVVLPYTIPKMISGGKNCYYLNLLYNLKTDELIFSETYNINASDHKDIINSHLYHTFNQIKSKKN